MCLSIGDRAIELAAKEMLDRDREKARARDQMCYGEERKCG